MSVTVEELEGEWSATEFDLVRQSPPALSVDVLALGGTFSLTIAPDARHTLFVSLPDGTSTSQAGPAVVQGRRLFLVDEGESEDLLFEFTLSGDSLTLTTDDLEYDFSGDGTAEPARGALVLERGPVVPT